MAGEQVLVGMSGGVDSAAAAALLLEKGYQVTGCLLRLHLGPEDPSWAQSLADAKAVADKLGIQLICADYSELFRRQVMDYFAAAYQAGLTPNPCVQCNRQVKFSALCQEADRIGAPYIATGHYAVVDQEKATGRMQLLRGDDRAKDQSYFLYPLSQAVLRRLLLPVGHWTKAQVRALAEERDLISFQFYWGLLHLLFPYIQISEEEWKYTHFLRPTLLPFHSNTQGFHNNCSRA